jgi:5-formyltetrahydrofolate cyclo-ligase
MWRVDNEENKFVLRRALLSRRRALTRQACLLLSRSIQARALQLPAYQTARSVALYCASQNEVGTEEILNNALASGRRVFYPRTAVDGAAEFIAVTSSADLCAGRHGIREPSGSQRLSGDERRTLTVFVPGMAFDRMGNRLGRGKGWYDRMLAWLEDQATLVALAYEFQIVDEVPTSIWDKKVHLVVTENQTINCGAVSAGLEAGIAVKGKGVF